MNQAGWSVHSVSSGDSDKGGSREMGPWDQEVEGMGKREDRDRNKSRALGALGTSTGRSRRKK